MQQLVIDFETYFDSDFSLKKLSTSEYVRDARFEVLLAVVYDPVGNEMRWGVGREEIASLLSTFNWDNVELIGHNLQFDGFILSQQFGIYPKRYSCTVSASRCVVQNMLHGHDLDTVAVGFGLGGKSDGLRAVKGLRLNDIPADLMDELLDYCKQDVRLTWGVYERLWRAVPTTEQSLIHWTTRAFCKPRLRVDTERAKAALDETIETAERTIRESGVDRQTLRSDAQLATHLRSMGYTPPMKKSLTTGKMTYAFAKSDDGLKAMLVDPNPDIRKLGVARLAAKSTIDETRANRLIEMGTSGNGSLAVYLNYWGAHTGRWSGGNKMNLQNFRRGSELRKSIIAPDGYVIGVGDLSQIEVRMCAWLTKETAILNAFRAYDNGTGPDIYKVTAKTIYDKPVEMITDEERFIGKTARLGLQFGMGPSKYQVSLALGSPPKFIDPQEAARIVGMWRASNANTVAYWNICQNMLQLMASKQKKEERLGGVLVDGKNQTLLLPSGRWLSYHDIHQDENGNFIYFRQKKPIYTYGGKITENIVQAVARDVVAHQMLKIDETYEVVSMAHDEILCLIPEAEAEAGLQWMLNVMKTPPPWCLDLPLNADGKVAKEYSK